MKKKNLNNSESITFLKDLYAQKYLFLIILVLFTLSTIIFYNFNNKIKKAKTQVTISYPSMDMFIAIDSLHESIFSLSQNKDIEGLGVQNFSYKKFNYDFTSALANQNNLINYLNKQTNADYLKIFNEQSLDPKSYFIGKNFEVTKHPKDLRNNFSDLRNNFSFILSLNHPLNFNAKEFLKGYVNYHKEKTLSQYIKNSEKKISNLATSFSFFKNFQSLIHSQELQNTNCLLEVDECLESQKKYLEYFDSRDQITDMIKNKLVKGVKQFSNNFSYEPILEINTQNVNYSNRLITNLIVSSLLSFILFFAIILFKEFFKDLLKKS